MPCSPVAGSVGSRMFELQSSHEPAAEAGVMLSPKLDVQVCFLQHVDSMVLAGACCQRVCITIAQQIPASWTGSELKKSGLKGTYFFL